MDGTLYSTLYVIFCTTWCSHVWYDHEHQLPLYNKFSAWNIGFTIDNPNTTAVMAKKLRWICSRIQMRQKLGPAGCTKMCRDHPFFFTGMRSNLILGLWRSVIVEIQMKGRYKITVWAELLYTQYHVARKLEARFTACQKGVDGKEYEFYLQVKEWRVSVKLAKDKYKLTTKEMAQQLVLLTGISSIPSFHPPLKCGL